MEKRNFREIYIYDINDDFIGKGEFGEAFKAKKNTNEKKALKIINKINFIQSFRDNYSREHTGKEMEKYFDDLLNEIEYIKMMEGKNKEIIY